MLSQFIKKACTSHKNNIAFQIRRNYRRQTFTFKEAYAASLRVATFLNIKKGDTILIISPNMPEYSIPLMAIAHLGAVAVPADARSSEETIQKYIEITNPKNIIYSRTIGKSDIVMEDILELSKDAKEFKPRNVGKDDLYEIVFTSGTTGQPKGVMITHGNILSDLDAIIDIVPKLDRYETVSILPLSHMFEQIISFFLMMSKGGTINYVPKLNSVTLSKELYFSECTHLAMVPQVMKNLVLNMEATVKEKGAYKKYMTMIRISSKLPFPVRRRLFSQVYEKLGNIEFIAVGGASLDMDSAIKLEAMGIQIIEGYGATEATAVATGPISIPKRVLGSIGKPLKNIQVKLKDNEILIKGPTVSKGYFKNPKKTKEVFKQGWYHTGDIGRFDSKGNLYFVGRDYFKIVLSNGENVYVEDIELVINNNAHVKDSCVIGIKKDGKEIIHAFLLLKEESHLDGVMRQINSKLDSKQQINAYQLWTDEDVPRTKTLKIDRKLVS